VMTSLVITISPKAAFCVTIGILPSETKDHVRTIPIYATLYYEKTKSTTIE